MSQELINLINHYHDNPVDFVLEVMQTELDDWQRKALQNLAEHHFLAIRSGSGVGKTFLMSAATLWFLSTRPYAKVPSTAPSQHQLFDVLWAEHFKWISRSPFLNKLLIWTQTKVAVKGHEPEWYAVARTAQVKPGSDVVEGLQGFHAEKDLLFSVDEASGVHDSVYPAVEGSLTGGSAYAFLAGNPTRTKGFFHDIFYKPEMRKFYKLMHVSCYDSPRVSERYIDMMEARYGKDHPIFGIKVLGEFPEADEYTLIPPDFIDVMENNSKNSVAGFPIEFGLDVGRSHAASVLCIRQGLNILHWDERLKKGLVTDTPEIVQWVREYINEFKPTKVKVDAIGIGAGVYDDLKLIHGDMIVPVIGAATAGQPERYINIRAQGCWELRELIPKLWCEKWPDRVIVELGDIRVKPTPTLKIKIESKEDMLARSMKSPDYFDALMYAFLDSDLCGDYVPIYVVPAGILEVNKDLKKAPIWSMERRNLGRRQSRWSGLNG